MSKVESIIELQKRFKRNVETFEAALSFGRLICPEDPDWETLDQEMSKQKKRMDALKEAEG